MLCYQSLLNTSQEFTQEILVHMFLEWLETTKNKMKDLSYTDIPFDYQIDHKHLQIKEFKNHILGIYFSTYDNYKKFKFIVEVFYDKDNHHIQIQFSKESREDSGYISRVSIPKIFRTLIQSPYLIEDTQNYPTIQINPQLISQDELELELLGIAKIKCNNDLKKQINIVYPDLTQETISFSKTIRKHEKYSFYDKIRQYHIQNYPSYSFKELSLLEMSHEYQSIQHDSLDLQQSFYNEINQDKAEIKELEELYEIYIKEYNQEKQNYDLFSKKQDSIEKTPLLVIDNHHELQAYQQLLYRILKRKANDLSSTHQIYRRLDIIQAILKEGEEE